MNMKLQKTQIIQIISNVLGKYRFYHNSITQLLQILRFIQMAQTNQPKLILEYTNFGILKLYQKYFQTQQKQKFYAYSNQQKFSSISKATKDYVSTIINQVASDVSIKLQQKMMNMMYMQTPQNPYFPYSFNPMMNGGVLPTSQMPTDKTSRTINQQTKKTFQNSQAMYQYYYNPYSDSNSMNSIGQSYNGQMMGQHMLNQGPSMRNFNRNIPNNYSMGTTTPLLSSNTMVPNNPYITNQNFVNPYSMMPSYPALAGVQPNYQNYPPNYINKPSIQQLQQQQIYNQKKNPRQTSNFSYQTKPKNYQAKNKTSQQQSSSKKQNPKINRIQQTNNLIVNESKSSKSPIKYIKAPVNIPLKSTTPSNFGKIVPSKNQNTNMLAPRRNFYADIKKLPNPDDQLINCPCRGAYDIPDDFTCLICKKMFHFLCLRMQIRKKQENKQNICCPHCKMRQIDPLNNIQKVVGQFYLHNLNESSFETILNFLPLQSYLRNKNSKYQIQIRCIRSGDHLNNLQIAWPDECVVKINDEKIIDIPALQSNSSLKKRKDYSVYLTHNIFGKNLSCANNLQTQNVLQKIKISVQLKALRPEQILQKKLNNDNNFALGIYLIQKLNTDQLYAKLMSQKNVTNKQFLLSLMKSPENQVQIDQITIKLTDPFSWDLINTPVRGNKCSHAQCFDLKTFISLMYSAKNRTWKCPVCSKDSRKFIVDSEQLQLIQKAKQIDPFPKQVQISKDGVISFKVQKQSDDQQKIQSRQIGKTKKIYKQKKQQTIRDL